MDYFELIKEARRLKTDPSWPVMKIAVLGDFATQHFALLLKVLLAKRRIHAEVYEADYDVQDQEILDELSGLYAFRPDVVLLLNCTQRLRERWYERRESANDLFHGVEARWDKLESRLPGVRILQTNWVIPRERFFGNFDARVENAWTSVVCALNLRLATALKKREGVYLSDVDFIASDVGRKNWFDEKLWAISKTPCALDVMPYFVANIADTLCAFHGRMIKCIAIDLDNTLWGGAIGEDGLEGIRLGHSEEGGAFRNFQLYLLQLKKRGVLLAACSKNDLEVAKIPFRSHPSMALKEEDFAHFVANWEDKASNLRNIARELNIGLDSIAFIDDEPFERGLVRDALPDVVVPEIPDDVAERAHFLSQLNLFESVAYAGDGEKRTEQYRAENLRKQEEQRHGSIDDYLKSLGMKMRLVPVDDVMRPRAAELLQRSNQFNLTTRRTDASKLTEMNRSKEWTVLGAQLTDKFGDSGLIGVILLQKVKESFSIHEWVMSCRVLKRGVEEFLMNAIVDEAKKNGCKQVTGEYIKTPKNKMVENFYGTMGFENTGKGMWILNVGKYKNRPTQIGTA